MGGNYIPGFQSFINQVNWFKDCKVLKTWKEVRPNSKHGPIIVILFADITGRPTLLNLSKPLTVLLLNDKKSHHPQSTKHRRGCYMSRSHFLSWSWVIRSAMVETELPEDIIVNILCWLPVKSLIRFTSVSKRFRSIILFDPKFAASQFKAACQRKTQGCRIMFSTDPPQLESLDMETRHTALYGGISSVRKLSFPFKMPGSCVTLLASCNGFVFVVFNSQYFYIWNPATGFFMELPELGFSDGKWLMYYGAGYLSATDDYIVLAAVDDVAENEDDEAEDEGEGEYVDNGEAEDEVKLFMFSLRGRVWKRIKHPHHKRLGGQGTLFNEALHWVNFVNRAEMLAFDLTQQEEFRTMRMPDGVAFGCVGVSEGCLCVCSHKDYAYAEFWVMREYGVFESWTKLFRFCYYADYYHQNPYGIFLVMENCTVAATNDRGPGKGDRFMLVKIDHARELEVGRYWTPRWNDWLTNGLGMITYAESLLQRLVVLVR